MEPVKADNVNELLDALASIDITVPLRTEGRTTEHCERWSMCRLLATIAESEFLRLPIIVTHRDRPDFHIQQGSISTGVEITEVVPVNDAAIEAYRGNNEVNGLFFLKRHRPGEEQLTGAALRSAATSDEPGDGWEGDSVEREWAHAMRDFISVKIEKAAKPGFQLFSENWLVMYDNWTLPGVDRKDAIKRLYASMKSGDFGPFHKIWIESPDVISCLSSSGVVTRSINDLWASS